MNGILKGLRVIEGSAFIAAPSAGMTMAQMGAEVIRFDPIGGGLDYRRWPVTGNGESIYWAGLNKGKKSIERPVVVRWVYGFYTINSKIGVIRHIKI